LLSSHGERIFQNSHSIDAERAANAKKAAATLTLAQKDCRKYHLGMPNLLLRQTAGKPPQVYPIKRKEAAVGRQSNLKILLVPALSSLPGTLQIRHILRPLTCPPTCVNHNSFCSNNLGEQAARQQMIAGQGL
jgi:hypothetical protein